jgi:hypothetical protein
MKIFKSTLAVALLLACTSCTYFNHPLEPRDTVNRKNAVLYGRFNLTQDNDDGFQLGLWLENVKTKSPVYLSFLATNSIYAVDVKPGDYRIQGFIAINREHQLKARHQFPPTTPGKPIRTTFTAESGAQIYIGDYSGRVTYDRIMVEWKVESLRNNFEFTTAEFRMKYPGIPYARATSIFQTGNGGGN